MQQNFDDIFKETLKDDLRPEFQKQPLNEQQTPKATQPKPTPTPQPNVPQKQLPVETIILDNVVAKIKHKCELGEVTFPDNYNVNNEVQLAIQNMRNNNIIATCTPDSIEGSLVEYAIQGLSISQKQAWFVGFGGVCTLLRSYFGDVAVCKRTNLIKDCNANVIYDGDEIEVDYDENLNKIVKNHKTKFGNEDNEILGAYAYIDMLDGTRKYCVMTKKEIDKNWELSKGKNKQTGEVKFQRDFPQEASKRTVIRRGIKMIFNTSVETNTFQKSIIDSYNRTTEKEYVDADFEETDTESMNARIHQESNTTFVADDLDD